MRVLVLSVLLIAVPATATQVYRWVDANGQTHYSDQWQPGAEKIQITTDSPASGPPPAAERADAGNTGGGAKTPVTPAPRYESLEITRPAQEEVLWNIAGQLPVSVRVTPALRSGDSLRLYLDGKQQELPTGSTEVQLQEVFRGVHTLKAEVANEAETVLIESPTVSFMVRQTSIATPGSAANP